MNFNKKSLGITFGYKGAHYTLNTKGQQISSIGIPGTGLYYTETKHLYSSNKQNKFYKKAQNNSSFTNIFMLIRKAINNLLNFLNMDNWSHECSILYRPEPQFVTATIKSNYPKDDDVAIPDDNTIINNIYTVIPENTPIYVECKNTETTIDSNTKKSHKINTVQYKRKMPKSELDAFLWQCNSVCNAREDSDVDIDFNMRLDNPDDLLETGYYYAMKEISDNKDT